MIKTDNKIVFFAIKFCTFVHHYIHNFFFNLAVFGKLVQEKLLFL